MADDVADGPDTIPATAAAISLADDVIDCDNSDLLIVPVTMKDAALPGNQKGTPTG